MPYDINACFSSRFSRKCLSASLLSSKTIVECFLFVIFKHTSRRKLLILRRYFSFVITAQWQRSWWATHLSTSIHSHFVQSMLKNDAKDYFVKVKIVPIFSLGLYQPATNLLEHISSKQNPTSYSNVKIEANNYFLRGQNFWPIFSLGMYQPASNVPEHLSGENMIFSILSISGNNINFSTLCEFQQLTRASTLSHS